MTSLRCLTVMAMAMSASVSQGQAPKQAVLVIHGGAGAEPRGQMTPAREKQYRDALTAALEVGLRVLRREGGTSLDAVEAAIVVLEDAPIFNAGKGAVFNREGRNELNASIMEGKTRRAGAVAGISRIKNPISAARAVMEKSPHVFLIGEGAERFARDQGLTMVSPLYFWTEQRWNELLEAQKKTKARPQAAAGTPMHFGTVGAVAVDAQGNLAAGTSTGGITYVMPGRVGDSPIIGAGTYAENAGCAVSCTGVGELFIRHAVAHEVSARVKYKVAPLPVAARAVLGELPPRTGGVGGLIALDAQGHYAAIYDTGAMPRGAIDRDGKISLAIYDD